MRLIGNLIWFIFGGLVMGLGWYLLGLVMFLSILGIPWGR
ncbi:MAG: YccF domain-containing protein, partial [Humidesulfovibrio sp.]|nr:YccF domain-containing protein [Humidesulfovibrio sp.]